MNGSSRELSDFLELSTDLRRIFFYIPNVELQGFARVYTVYRPAHKRCMQSRLPRLISSRIWTSRCAAWAAILIDGSLRGLIARRSSVRVRKDGLPNETTKGGSERNQLLLGSDEESGCISNSPIERWVRTEKQSWGVVNSSRPRLRQLESGAVLRPDNPLPGSQPT